MKLLSSSGSLVPPYQKKSAPRDQLRRVTFEGKLRRATISRSCATIPFTRQNSYFPFSVNRVAPQTTLSGLTLRTLEIVNVAKMYSI